MRHTRIWDLNEQTADVKKLLADGRRVAVARDGPKSDVLRQLDRPSKKLRERTAPLIVSLGILASYEETVGALRVLEGDPLGWSQMRLGFLYRAWSIRCRYAVVDREKGNQSAMYSPLLMNQEPHCLAEAIATKDDVFAHGFGKKLIANFQAYGGGDPVYFYTIPFHPFMFKLYALWVSFKAELRKDVANPLGRYQVIVDSWNDGSTFGRALEAICDYHCEQCFQTSEEHSAFAWFPYNVFPVEILAIQRIRRELGLSVPEIEHPLLKSALVNVPVTPPSVKDELLERIKERARTDFPEIGDPW